MKKTYWILLLPIAACAVLFLKFGELSARQTEVTAAATAGAPPVISSWLLNRTNLKGYNNIAANVQQVRYSANYVYINSTDIPAYGIGPWPNNPNTASNQNYVFKIPRSPVAQGSGTHTSTPLGAIGVWRDGVALFNALDAMSYNNQNIWHQNAVFAEAVSFDNCLGHPQQQGAYHHHQNPRCLYNINSAQHSPLIGYAFDGFPIYGAYGYANADGSGGIKRIMPGYQTRNIAQRQSLPDGTILQPGQYGPDVSATRPLGYYAEDYQYVAGSGDLDEYNGRFAVTPEYPGGTYAYYVTIYENGTGAYPYYLGPKYYGAVQMENITTNGHVTVSEATTIYVPKAVASDFDGDGRSDTTLFRPSSATWYVQQSTAGSITAAQFGLSSDQLVPADYDGDGKSDIAIFRDGVWAIRKSSDGSNSFATFGQAGDFPVIGDYDADGKTDLAVFRPSTSVWYILRSSDGVTDFRVFGDGVTDKAAQGDYDGDGKTDVAVFRPSTSVWYILKSSDNNLLVSVFGSAGDKPLPADYDGDGKTDLAVFRPSTAVWFWINSRDGGVTAIPFGNPADKPEPGDYDGDGKTDPAIFRDGVWAIRKSSDNSNSFITFGQSGDIPIPGIYIPQSFADAF